MEVNHNFLTLATKVMLELKNICYRPSVSQKAVLNRINLTAIQGRPIVVAGCSGSGKTSLIEVISGLSTQSHGQVIWSKKVLTTRQRRWLCGVVFQFPERHFLGLTVAQELRLGHKRLSSERQTISLKKVGLNEINPSQAPERLSGGQQRRLALAVQLLRKPKVLLLDEPTAGLDWSVRDEVIDLLTSISKEQILIIVTHEPELFKDSLPIYYCLQNGELQTIMNLSNH